uniref:Ca2+/calmodulin-dependent protein phosphatase calcineurin subunit b n=1 Tax=Rhabditophanes sp. KR3021 TaxID=114890 RepID=A0AC35TRY6_9BILA
MGNSNGSAKLPPAEIKNIMAETGFTKNQVTRLYLRFRSLDCRGEGLLQRDDFLKIPELVINPLGDRIIDAFFRDRDDIHDNINFHDFARVMAHFRPVASGKKDTINSRIEKLRFAFSMYDLNKNGYITREEFKVILNMMVGSNITWEQLECIADRTITEADTNKDGKISFDEFCKAMEKTDIEQKMSIRFVN